jgi:hypothetical protein
LKNLSSISREGYRLFPDLVVKAIRGPDGLVSFTGAGSPVSPYLSIEPIFHQRFHETNDLSGAIPLPGGGWLVLF